MQHDHEPRARATQENKSLPSTMASAKQQIDGYSYAPVAAVPIYGDDGEEDPLAESFFGAAVASSAETVSPDARPYLEVVAPSTLPEVSILHIIMT